MHDHDSRPGRLPVPLQRKMERAYGESFADVRLEVGGVPGRMGAHAFAEAGAIHVAPGSYRPGTVEGDALIGHELAHIVQQRRGGVATAAGGPAANTDAALEREADDAGARASRGETVRITGAARVPGRQAKFVVGHIYQPAAGLNRWYNHDTGTWETIAGRFECVKKIDGSTIKLDDAGELYQVRLLDDPVRNQVRYVTEEVANQHGDWQLGDRLSGGQSLVARPDKPRKRFQHGEAFITKLGGGRREMVGFGDDVTTEDQQHSSRWRTEVTWSKTAPGVVHAEGTHMVARTLGPDHPVGSGPANNTQGNAQVLSQLSGQPWIGGHMLNDNVGGSGRDPLNIVAIPHTLNVNMECAVEDDVKQAVNDRGRWVHYEMQVLDYHDLSDLRRGLRTATRQVNEKHGSTLAVGRAPQQASTLRSTWYLLGHDGNRTGDEHIHELHVPKVKEKVKRKKDGEKEGEKEGEKKGEEQGEEEEEEQDERRREAPDGDEDVPAPWRWISDVSPPGGAVADPMQSLHFTRSPLGEPFPSLRCFPALGINNKPIPAYPHLTSTEQEGARTSDHVFNPAGIRTVSNQALLPPAMPQNTGRRASRAPRPRADNAEKLRNKRKIGNPSSETFQLFQGSLIERRIAGNVVPQNQITTLQDSSPARKFQRMQKTDTAGDLAEVGRVITRLKGLPGGDLGPGMEDVLVGRWETHNGDERYLVFLQRLEREFGASGAGDFRAWLDSHYAP